MFVLFTTIAIVSATIILPGWIIARRENPQGPAILFLAFPAIILWVGLAAAGVGAQSLANLVETFAVGIVSVIVAYVKLFVMDRYKYKYGGIVSLFIVLGITLLLRLFVPVIPE